MKLSKSLKWFVDVFGRNNTDIGVVKYSNKEGIGKADDVMADGVTNKRAHTSARIVRKDPNFKNAQPVQRRTYKGITKGQMIEIEARRVLLLRALGNKLPLRSGKTG